MSISFEGNEVDVTISRPQVQVSPRTETVTSSSPGPAGPQGPPGPAGGTAITFTFTTPATQWLVTHNLSRYPEPIIFLTGQTTPTLADINYLSADAFTVTFLTAQTGRVEI